MIIRYSGKYRAWIASVKIDGKRIDFVSKISRIDAMQMAFAAKISAFLCELH